MLLHWKQLAQKSSHQLASFDIAEKNLICAMGFPGSDAIDVPLCLRTLDSWAAKVSDYICRVAYIFHRRPQEYRNSWAYFRVLCMITVLQRDLGVRYNPAKKDDSIQLEPADSFIHGVILGNGGTCASLPVVYVAVGRRLGFPLYLVAAKTNKWGHSFVRWDEPGERFNIEATIQGLCSDPDDHYRTGVYEVAPKEERFGGLLVSLSPKQELAGFLMERGCCLAEVSRYREALDAFLWAWSLYPENVLYQNRMITHLNEWGKELERIEPPGYPPMTFWWPPRRFPSTLPWDYERDFIYLEATEQILKDARHERNWWNPMRNGWPLHQKPVEIRINCDLTKNVIGFVMSPCN